MHIIRTLTIVASAILLTCCHQGNTPENKKDSIPSDNKKKHIDTVTSLVDQQDSLLVFKAPDGKYYHVSLVPEESSVMKGAKFDCKRDEFFGVNRKAAKTSIAVGSASTYTVLTNFLQRLKADSIMDKHPGINQDSANSRVGEENKNVKLTRIFMYAIKREDDNDYHIIVGDRKGNFLNVECSGLPVQTAASYTRLKSARKQVKDFFGPVCMWNYRKFDPAIEVEISGSLFFDIDHDAGAVGPIGLRPKTSWEIHPVSSIVFK